MSSNETLAEALGKPSGDFHLSLSSGLSFTTLGPLPAPQHPFLQLEASGTGNHLGDPQLLMTHGDWAV